MHLCFGSAKVARNEGTWGTTLQTCPRCLCVGAPAAQTPCPSLRPPGLHLALIERRVLGAIPAGRFFTHADGEGGWRPFKWSTWRLWPVINEFAVSHGSCKETSGKKRKKKWGGREGGRVLSLEFGTGYLCQDEKWLQQISFCIFIYFIIFSRTWATPFTNFTEKMNILKIAVVITTTKIQPQIPWIVTLLHEKHINAH